MKPSRVVVLGLLLTLATLLIGVTSGLDTWAFPIGALISSMVLLAGLLMMRKDSKAPRWLDWARETTPVRAAVELAEPDEFEREVRAAGTDSLSTFAAMWTNMRATRSEQYTATVLAGFLDKLPREELMLIALAGVIHRAEGGQV